MAFPPILRGEDGLPAARRPLAVAVVLIGTTMSVLDASVTNVALPTIAQELTVDPSTVVWVANAYQLATAIGIVALAALGDMVGYRRVYLAGLGLFTVASAGCALAPSLGALIAARVLQGLGASAMMSVGPALNRIIFPGRLLGTALGLSALTVAASSAAGPTLGGLILAVADWPWLFAINLPLGLGAFLLGRRTLPLNERRLTRFDALGAGLAAVAMGCFVVAIDGLSKHYAWPVLIGLWGACAVAAFLFIRWQARAPQPLLPLDLFRAARFSLAAVASMCSFVAQGLTFVALPFLFQGGYGYSPLMSGLLFTPWPLTIVVAAPVAGRLADRYSPRLLSTIGLAVLAVGLVMMALLGPGASVASIIWRASLCGLGFGFFQSPNNRELMGSVPKVFSGAASGVLASARTFGQSVGAALAAILLVAPEPGGHPAGGIGPALWVAGAFAALAFLVSAGRVRSR